MHSMLNATRAGSAFLAVSVVLGTSSGALAAGLFARGIAVEGGLVSVEAGVMGDPSRPPLPFGRSKQPVRYFVDLKNETPADLWLDVELQRPEKKAKSDFGRVRAGYVGHWTWPAIGVVWNEPASFPANAVFMNSIHIGSAAWAPLSFAPKVFFSS